MEVSQAYQWVVSTAQADTSLMSVAVGGVWESFADIGVTGAHVLVQHQASSDVLTLNAVRLFASLLLQIKMVGPTNNFAALVTGANRLDFLFGRTGPIGLSSGGVLSCFREQQLSFSELVNGTQWAHLGGLYRIALQGV